MSAALRPIKGWPDCFIDEDGNVFRNGRQKATPISKVGYRVVNFSRNNKSHTFYVHRLLLEAFVGPCPDGCEALHINGNPLDNSISNLRWGTRKENVADAISHGTATVGSRNKQAKLMASDLGWIFDMKAMGFYTKEIAATFCVSTTTIQRVISGRSYKRDFK